MDLDNTEIVIRERSLSQRIDLSFHLIRRFAREILLYSLVGITPFFVLNILIVEGMDPTGYWEYYAWGGKWLLILFLTIVEGPFAMAPLLIFLSQRIFRQRVKMRETLLRSLRSGGRLWVIYFLIRANLLFVVVALASYNLSSGEWFVSLIIAALMVNGLFFAARPYVDSVVLLEELKFRPRGDEPRLGNRSASLHRYQSADQLGEGVGLLSLNLVIFCGIYATCLWCIYLIWQNTVTFNWFSWTLFAVALWSTMIYSTVFRFLGYLDTRVRLEGWELELRLKAEGSKAFGQLEEELGRASMHGSAGGRR